MKSERRANWMIYRISDAAKPILEENLKCLQDLSTEDPVFMADLKCLRATDTSAACCPTAS